VTTQAPLRSSWTKAKSVCHVRVLGDGESPTSPTKDTRLLGVGSSAWFSDDAPQHPAWAMYRMASPRLRPDGTADSAHDVTPLPAWRPAPPPDLRRLMRFRWSILPP
jgi:hypothetical protein